MAGPAIGGLLAAISITAPFFFYAATLAVAGTVGLLLLRTRSERPADAAPTSSSARCARCCATAGSRPPAW